MNAKDLLLRVAMSVEQTRQRLGAAEGVIRELKVHVQRVTGHQAAHGALQSLHQEMKFLRSQIDTRSRIRLVELKSLIPGPLGKKSGPGTWSYLARDFVGLVHSVLEQALKNAGNRKQPTSASNI